MPNEEDKKEEQENNNFFKTMEETISSLALTVSTPVITIVRDSIEEIKARISKKEDDLIKKMVERKEEDKEIKNTLSAAADTTLNNIKQEIKGTNNVQSNQEKSCKINSDLANQAFEAGKGLRDGGFKLVESSERINNNVTPSKTPSITPAKQEARAR